MATITVGQGARRLYDSSQGPQWYSPPPRLSKNFSIKKSSTWCGSHDVTPYVWQKNAHACAPAGSVRCISSMCCASIEVWLVRLDTPRPGSAAKGPKDPRAH